MQLIKFKIEGMINSMRMPETASYQNTQLTPKKTHIAGLLTNIMGKTEKFYYDTLLPNLKVGIIPIHLENIYVDLWQYKKWKKSNIGGRAVVKREKLFNPQYIVYVALDKDNEDLLQEIYISLKNPRRAPSLGLDDELVIIKNVDIMQDAEILKNTKGITTEVYSTFPSEFVKEYEFKMILKEDQFILPPRIIKTNLLFDMGPPRRPKKYLNIVEFFGGYCSVSFKDNYEIIEDKKLHVVMW